MKKNMFDDTRDLLFQVEHGIDWNTIVPLLEDDFDASEERPFENVQEAVEFYKEVLKLVGQIAGKSIAPRAADVDREGNRLEAGRVTYAQGVSAALKEMKDAGLLALTLQRRYGGQNLPAVVSMIVTELVSQADAAFMNIIGLIDAVAETVEHFGSEEAKEKYLPRLAAGEATGAMALTEPEAGSDLGRITTRGIVAENREGVWLLKGTKRFITNGCGDLLLVLARTDLEKTNTTRGLSLFICPKSEKVEIISLENKLGIKGSPTCELSFDEAECEVLGRLGSGFKEVLVLMNTARLGVACQAVGIAESALHEAVAYAEEREQFEGPINLQPPVRDMLEQMTLNVEGMRALAYKTAELVDRARGYERKLEKVTQDTPQRDDLRKKLRHAQNLARVLTMLSKYWCAEKSIEVTSLGIQVMGGNGYMKDFPMERHYRDARITSIYEGTSEIQALMAMRDLMGGRFNPALDEIMAWCQEHGGQQEAGEGAGEKKADDEYSAGGYAVEDEDAAASGPGPAAMLVAMCEKLKDAAQFIMGDVGESGSDAYGRLRAKALAEMATSLYIGYLFMRHGEVSDRKKILGRLWLSEWYPRFTCLYDRIVAGDKTALEHFDTIIYGKN